MKYRFSDVYSEKNSLAIIYMCLKMHCLKYVINFILFYFISIHVAQVWLSNVPLCPSPLSQVDHSNLLFSSAAPPFSSHQVREVSGGAAHGGMVRLAMSRRSPLRFSLKSSPSFAVSLVVPVERWKFVPFTPVLAAPLHFFSCITQSM